MLSPKVMLGDVGQLREVTHRMLKFYEYVGIGRSEQSDWQSLVWKSAQVNGLMHFGSHVRVKGSPYRSGPPEPE